MRRLLSPSLLLASSLLASGSAGAEPRSASKPVVYVWLFSAKSESVEDLTDLYTVDFDEALTQTRCLPKLNRMDDATIQLHREGERERVLPSADFLTPRERRLLGDRNVDAVVLGEIRDDTQGGVIRVGVRVNAFSGEDLGAASVTLIRGKVHDSEERKAQMVKLAKNLCADLGFSGSTSEAPPPPNGGDPQPPPKPSCPPQKDQFWGKIRFSLTAARLSGDTLEVDFVVSNEYPTDRSFVLFGGGPVFGHDPSRLFVDRMEYKATGIAFGSESGEWIARNTVPSAAGLTATLSFRGVPRDLTKLEILELNYSDGSNVWKQGTAQFRGVCLE